MGNKFIYLLNLRDSIDEKKPKGGFIRRQMEDLLIAVFSLVRNTLYFAFKWLMRGLRADPAIYLYVVLVAALILAFSGLF